MPTTCACCGREGLQKTVKMTDGETVVWMGVGCAAKAAGGARRYARELEKAEANRLTDFCKMLCPEFADRYFERFCLVGVGRAERMAKWDRTGIVPRMSPKDAKIQFGLAMDALGIGVDGSDHQNPNVGNAKFVGDEIDIALRYVREIAIAWVGEEEAARKGYGTRVWYEKLLAWHAGNGKA